MSIIDLNPLINIKEKEQKAITSDVDFAINKVQEYGYKEIQEYERLLNEFINNVKQLSVFNKVMEDVVENQIIFFLKDEILNSFVKMIFEGEQPPFLDDITYQEIRKHMYNNLANKYFNNDK